MNVLYSLTKKAINYVKLKRYKRLKRKISKYEKNLKTLNKDARYITKVIRYTKLKLSRFFLKIYYVYPVKKNKVVFMSYQGGQYTCNPKKLSEYLMDKYPKEFDIVWVFNRPDKFNRLKEKGIRVVRYGSKEYFKEVLTAKVFVYNMRIPEGIPFRKKQLTISTGHGGGAYKKLLLDIPGITRKDIKQIEMSSNNTDIYVSTCEAYTKHVIRGAYGHEGEVLEVGMPRNDELVNNDKSLGVNVRKYYDLPEDTKILLYAPTYRKTKKTAADYGFNALRLKKACEERFGGNWVVMYRLHHFIKTSFLSEVSKRGIIDATNYKDMQELISACDILVTDYSSSIWDFSLTGKPCFIYATDLKKYLKQQGFYTSIYEWPFPLCKNNAQLKESILNFDEEKYKAAISDHHKQLGIKESGKATEIIGERIYKECTNN